ncbi:hypothetical protein [Burkholderia stabilis]|uniref:hypothetical protein n=1 Tax=Burkholderia stabilis TaxID=95485 RepID=UPI0012E9FE63|nr:hypothetical protein [Burkholderia stabilis]HDR9491607.1 hypothetical protein [Burkholderia stabilis]HDR9522228.1 hypothetical protein [Burkholderia stabilis]HDR9529477.1 hypothetical protein [Burkholderia stabilis]HDR9539058.1 hypothetical protein [Burkholderia stabilis]HDR9547173.1 hypothetical protein [Burkholderia stabilis]
MDIAVTAYADPDASPASLAHDRAAAVSFLKAGSRSLEAAFYFPGAPMKKAARI